MNSQFWEIFHNDHSIDPLLVTWLTNCSHRRLSGQWIPGCSFATLPGTPRPLLPGQVCSTPALPALREHRDGVPKEPG
jgi:hypothetical protein